MHKFFDEILKFKEFTPQDGYTWKFYKEYNKQLKEGITIHNYKFNNNYYHYNYNYYYKFNSFNHHINII